MLNGKEGKKTIDTALKWVAWVFVVEAAAVVQVIIVYIGLFHIRGYCKEPNGGEIRRFSPFPYEAHRASVCKNNGR